MSGISGISGVAALAPLAAMDFIAPEVSLRSIAYASDDEVGPLTSPPAADDAAGAGPSFSSVLGAQLQQLDSSLKAGEQQALALASGRAESLHRVMLSVEEARLGLQLALQVRNRLVDALQDLQRWQL